MATNCEREVRSKNFPFGDTLAIHWLLFFLFQILTVGDRCDFPFDFWRQIMRGKSEAKTSHLAILCLVIHWLLFFLFQILTVGDRCNFPFVHGVLLASLLTSTD